MVSHDPLRTQREIGASIPAGLREAGFEDVTEIGRGGFGIVYRCAQSALERTVAVKVLTSDLDRENLERFLREQRAMGRLSGHPNIVGILFTGVIMADRPYIVMPFHPRGSLQRRIEQDGPLRWQDGLRIGVRLAGALETAHQSGVLHRDVKPGNVLLNGYGEPELSDFGIAHVPGGFVTTSGIITGSPAFTAPEVLKGHLPTVASDIYSLGSTLFCLITGHAAFERRTGEKVMSQFLRITSEPVPDLRERHIPDDVCAAIERAMSEDPADRFATAAAFGGDLCEIQRRHRLPVDNMALPDGQAAASLDIVDSSDSPSNDRGDVMADAPTPPGGSGLPVDMTSLVGRKAESAEVRRVLADSRLVTLTGIGGVGKTRLAVHVARKVQRGFADGVVLVELADLADHALVGLTVAQAVGAPTHQPDVVGTLIDYLRGRELLLVLDNCEHLLDESAILVRNLLSTCAGLRILVTSREPLRVSGEHVFEVDPLAVHRTAAQLAYPASAADSRPDAVALFADRALAAAPTFRITADNAQTIEELCRRLDGLPLAIELAAGRMRALSPRELLDRLDDRHKLLSVGDRSAAPRHQSLWATLDWSYELCSDRERLLWERLSVFTGAVHLQAAECICSSEDLPRDAVVDCISALVDKSILAQHSTGGTPTYRMLETVRDYGLRKLHGRPAEAEINGRYRTYYQRLAREFEENWFGPGQEQMVERMRGEHANLRAVLDSLLSDPAGGRAALGMAAALFWYWLGCGQQREGRHWLDRALASDSAASSERAAALWSNGYLAVAEGKAVVALELLRTSQALAKELGDTVNLAHATHFRGVAEHNLGNTMQGMALIEEGSAMEAEGGPGLLHILALEQLGWAYCRKHEPDRALEVLEQCRQACTAHGERWLLSWIQTFLGLAQWMRGEFAEAGLLLREALAGKRPFHDALGIAVVLEILSWVAAAEGDPGRSARLMGAVRQVWEPLGDYPGGFELRTWSDQTGQEVRALLGDNAFENAFSEGGRLGTERATGYALGEAAPVEEQSSTDDALIAALTPREAQVARMLAEGMTNKQIAQALIIAPRTVETHVEHIFTKLGVNNRTQVASLLATQ
ncbi:protein kinase domain-containing protein [Nocardia sp. NPDC004711]